MIAVRPVAIPNGAFVFCRWSLALLLWVAFVLQVKALVPAVTVILLASALSGVDRAPMIVLWSATLGRIVPSKTAVLDRNAMRFAHALGTLFGVVATVLLYTLPRAGAMVLLAFCVVKSVAAFGFCSASKLYECVSAGGCCGIVSRAESTPK